MARLILAVPLELESRFAREASRHGHDVLARCVGSGELAEAILSMAPTCVIVLATPALLDADVLAVADSRGVRVIAVVETAAHRRYAAELGVRETADAASDWLVIDPLLSGLGAIEPVRPPTRGIVVVVWGPGGAPGRTTVATTLASEFSAVGHRVLLMDVDTHGAAVAPTLGLLDEAPGFAAACRLAGADSLTHDELERIAQHYESPVGGFRVLTGIGRPSRWPELSEERVAATIEQARSWADLVVVDTSSSLEADEEISSDLFAPRRNAAAITAVRVADRLVVVGAADPIGMTRLLRSHPEGLEVATTGDVTVVMNKVRSGAAGMKPAAHVRQTLARFGGIQDPAIIPYDQGACDRALLAGRTLTDAAPRSPARIALRDVAARLAPPPVSPRRARRRR